MKKLNSLLSLALISSSVLMANFPALAQADTDQSTQAAGAIQTIINDYRAMKHQAPTQVEQNADITMVCLDTVFLKWSNSYLAILKTTAELTATDIGPLADFGQLYYESEEDIPMVDSFRKGTSKAVNSAFASIMASTNTPELVKLTLADVSEDLYMQTLSLCGSPDFVAAATAKLPKPDGTKPLSSGFLTPNPFTTIWTCSNEGGLALTRMDGTDDAQIPNSVCAAPAPYAGINNGIVAGSSPSVGPAVHAIVSPARPKDYQSFLDNLRNE